VGELSEVARGVVGLGGDPEDRRVELPAGILDVGAQQSIPDSEEQPEVHVTHAWPAQVVEPVHRVQREHAVQPAGGVVDVGVLHQELDGDQHDDGGGNVDGRPRITSGVVATMVSKS
jgi:hypothetical protein